MQNVMAAVKVAELHEEAVLEAEDIVRNVWAAVSGEAEQEAEDIVQNVWAAVSGGAQEHVELNLAFPSSDGDAVQLTLMLGGNPVESNEYVEMPLSFLGSDHKTVSLKLKLDARPKNYEVQIALSSSDGGNVQLTLGLLPIRSGFVVQSATLSTMISHQVPQFVAA